MLWAVSMRPYGVDEAMPLKTIRLAESRNALRSAAVPVRVRLDVPDPPTVTPLPVVDVSVGAGDGEAGPPVTESTTVSRHPVVLKTLYRKLSSGTWPQQSGTTP